MDEFSAMALERLIPVFDHLYDECLPGRHVEGVNGTLKQTQQNDVGHGDAVTQGQHRQCERLQHGKRLGDDQDAVAVPAINPNASKRSQQQHRYLSRKAHQAEEES